MPKYVPSRRGLTLIELLVAIFIIGILVAILLPAVQAAREAARQATCKSNEKQLVLACLSHESVTRRFPIGRFASPADKDSGPDAPSWSWLADLLPFVEQGALHAKGGVPTKTHRASGIAYAEPPLFYCPSDPFSRSGPLDDRPGMLGLPIGLTNYQAISGANWGGDASQSKSHIKTMWRNKGTNGSYDGLENGDGMMHRSDYRRPRTTADIRDGLSNTFVLGEALPAANDRISWPYANHAYATCAIPPNKASAAEPTDWQNGAGLHSEHSGGVHVACVDGSVRFVNNDIDLAVYRALATIAGGEAVKE